MKQGCGFDIETPSGTAHRVTNDYFLEHVLPPLPTGFAVDKVVASIRRTGKKGRRLITQHGYWRGFSDEPQAGTRGKTATFAHLAPIANAICKVGAARGYVPTMQLVQHLSEEEKGADETTLPDGCVIPVSSDQETWEGIAAVGWYSQYDDIGHSRKTVQRLEQSLRYSMSNYRRRFMFGFTILNSALELWFMDRTQLLVSEPIDWITDHSALVRFFVALLFSHPHQLGWDTTMTTICMQGGVPQFDVIVEDVTGSQTRYRTLELIASSQSELKGKGTRVWRAVELRNGSPYGDPVVLKDVWRHGELAQEGSIIQFIRESVTSETERLFLDDHLPTVLHHGDVVIRSGSSLDTPHLDSTQTHIRNLQTLCAGQRLAEPSILQPGTRLGPYLSDAFNSEGRSEIRGRRIHYRIVFKEDCIPLHREKSPTAVFNALADVALVIHIMHDHGWVHRDLSYGNILLDSKAKMRLIDFEFAKKYGSTDVPEFRVGTSSFMAAEIDSQAFLFVPGSAPPPNVVKSLCKRYPLLDGDNDDFKPALDSSVEPQTSYSDPPSFFYNPLHDLESLWWLGDYFVFDHGRKLQHREKSRKAARGNACRSAQAHFPEELFDNHNKRHNVMRITGLLAQYASFLPQSLRPAAAALEKLRRELMTAYDETEKDDESISRPIFAGLHYLFADAMRSIATIVSAASKTAKTDPDAAPAQQRKRSRKDDTPLSTNISIGTKRPRVA